MSKTTPGDSKMTDLLGVYDSDAGLGIATLDSSGNVVEPNAAGLLPKVIDIGDWDMSTATGIGNVSVAHGLTMANIRVLQATIRHDVGAAPHDFLSQNGSESSEHSIKADGTSVNLFRGTGGFFDNTSYDTASSYNRGWITIWYVP